MPWPRPESRVSARVCSTLDALEETRYVRRMRVAASIAILVILVALGCGGLADRSRDASATCGALSEAEQAKFMEFIEANRTCAADSDCSVFVPPPGKVMACFYTAVATAALPAASAYWTRLSDDYARQGCQPQMDECGPPVGGPFVVRCDVDAGSCIGGVAFLQ
jgi:hypothetical protein